MRSRLNFEKFLQFQDLRSRILFSSSCFLLSLRSICFFRRLCISNSLEMERKEVTHSEDPIHGASSSLSSLHVGDYEGGTKKPKGNDYEVFLSFRGKDTRKGFTDYLYTSLIDAGIHVFRDDNELRVGEEIGPDLLYSITQSKISIPIISEDYTSSKWCLRELAQMLKCKRSRGQIVLPIFYKVEPVQVRFLMERLGDAMDAHAENLDETIVKEWKEVLKEVSFLKGWESEKIDNGHEGVLVKTVVRKVMSELKNLFQLSIPKQLVGIDDHVEQIMSFIDVKSNGARIIGIYGMGGIGKGIEVLSLMSLIKIDKDGKLMMHDQLRDLGREIVRLENHKERQMRSRLWIYEEAVDVLESNKGTRRIEALQLGICGRERRHTAEKFKYGRRRSYTADQFKELINLRFLQVNGANFMGDFQNLLPQLRWLQWQDCPSDFPTANFHPNRLVVLDLSWSGISDD